MEAKDFESIIINSNAAHGETLDIYYKDGEVVSGFVHRVSHFPTRITLCKTETIRGINSNHLIRLDQIEKLVTHHPLGESKVYE